jgi:hypothetical protein
MIVLGLPRGRFGARMAVRDNMSKLLTICPDFPDWPRRWMGDERDLQYGHDLLEAMRPFADHLAQSGLTDKTLKNHLTNLWLLGGEIIRDVNAYKAYSVPAAEKLKLSVGPDGGPSCRHLDSESQQRSYDRTCRMLHRFLEGKLISLNPRRGPSAPG